MPIEASLHALIRLGKPFECCPAYRSLSLDYDRNNLVTDPNMKGPMITSAFRECGSRVSERGRRNRSIALGISPRAAPLSFRNARA
jgi:hypothetical protein